MKPLNDIERLGILQAQQAVRHIVAECPQSLHGEQLVAALCSLLQCQADERRNEMASIGIAAAAIAALVENERAQRNGERSVVA
jgi:hypothetical protein